MRGFVATVQGALQTPLRRFFREGRWSRKLADKAVNAERRRGPRVGELVTIIIPSRALTVRPGLQPLDDLR